MGGNVSEAIVGVAASAAGIIAAIALLIKARGTASQPRHLLQRVMDWLETTGLAEKMPPTLKHSVERELAKESDDDDAS